MNNSWSSQYNSGVRNINNDFAAKRTANTFSRGLSAKQGARKLTDFSSGFKRQLPQFQANFANRGLGNSGVYQRAMQNFAGDYTRDRSRMVEDNDAQRYQFDLNDSQFVSERDSALSDLGLWKAQQISNTAQNINALRPYMG